MRTHAKESFCAVCGDASPALGSACVVPKLASCASRLAAGERRRVILDLARRTSVDGKPVEAAVDMGDHVDLYIDASEAERAHPSADIIRARGPEAS